MFLTAMAVLAIQSSRLDVGTAWSGEELLRCNDKAAEIDESHRFSLSFRITGKEGNMLIAERRSRLLGSRVMDTDLPPPPDPSPVVTKEWLSPAGFLLDADPFEKGEFNLDRLIHFWMPANQPDQWTAELSSTSANFVAKGRAEFKSIGKGNGTSREFALTYTSPGNPDEITASGKMRFDVATGRLLTAKIEAKHAYMPGGIERANVTLIYTDSKMTKPFE